MAAAGVPLRTLQYWMGHADSKTTQIYAHYQPAENEAEIVDRAFAPAACTAQIRCPVHPLQILYMAWANDQAGTLKATSSATTLNANIDSRSIYRTQCRFLRRRF
jgi:hypothetical protein